MDPVLAAFVFVVTVAVGLLTIWLMRRSVIGTLVFYLAVCFFVPYWIGVGFGLYLPVQVIVGMVVVLAHHRRIPFDAWGSIEWALAIMVFCSLVATIVFGALPGLVTVMITHWAVAYVVGGAVSASIPETRVARTISFVAIAGAAEALYERVTDSHPFTTFVATNKAYELWAPLQERAGAVRIEGALGHSIALGAALALAIPFLMNSRLNLVVTSGGMVVLLAAIYCTQSRGAYIAAVVAIVAGGVLVRGLPDLRRIAIVIASIAAGAGALTVYQRVNASGGVEASGSSNYRLQTLDDLVNTIPLIGHSTTQQVDGLGNLRFGAIVSIDNSYLLVAAYYGIVAAAVLVVGSVVVIVRAAGWRLTVSEAALIGQIPVLVTAPFFTQHQILLWLVVGLAVGYARKQRRAPAPGHPPTTVVETQDTSGCVDSESETGGDRGRTVDAASIGGTQAGAVEHPARKRVGAHRKPSEAPRGVWS